jgi:hypothetical protein
MATMYDDAPADLPDGLDSLLQRAFGRSAELISADDLAGNRDRSRIWRLWLYGGSAPATAVLKQSRGDGEDTTERFLNEAASLELLSSLDVDAAYAPRLYGADAVSRLLLMEDLSDGASLADLLLGNDAAAAEAGLRAYMRSLGRMHAATAGKVDAYNALRHKDGGRDQMARLQTGVREKIAKVPDAFAAVNFEWTPGLVDDIQRVAEAMLTPGPLFALTHGDPCPDNNRLIVASMPAHPEVHPEPGRRALEGRAAYARPDGAGELRLFDFEFAAFRHAFFDAAYARAPFPTCWCANRLPEYLIPLLEAEYRAKIVGVIPEAMDDAWFGRAMTETCAYWLIRTAVDFDQVNEAMREDRTWGIATIRQRVLHRLDVFSRLAIANQHLEALAAYTTSLRDRLEALWAGLEPMPLYPAFRGEAS